MANAKQTANKPHHLSISDYTYDLPDDKIAKYPLKNRDESKLLTLINDTPEEHKFKDIAQFIPEHSLLVWNNTKVIRARLAFEKKTGAKIEVFCLEPHQPADYNMAFSAVLKCQWACIIGNSKKWKTGTLSKKIEVNEKNTTLTIEKGKLLSTSQVVNFSWDNQEITFGEILENTGNVPIPPYLNREAESNDILRYQTIYSKHQGSVAAPTAGLHFTDSVFETLDKKNIQRHEVTLHVGAGTFKPVKDDKIGEHEMHIEHFYMNRHTLPKIINNLENITAVGTTTVRTLESMYWLGVKLLSNNNPEKLRIKQWEAYELNSNIPVTEALETLHEYILSQNTQSISAETAIMIAPGYPFKVVDRLITNFHQPQSTLLLLIAAFIGDNWKEVYNYALNNNFRFLSYGDSCFLHKKKEQ